MNGNDINVVVDNLCKKLGTAKEMLIPELARMCVARHSVNAIACLVLFIAAAYMCVRCIKIKADKDSSWSADQCAEMGLFLVIPAACGFFIALWINAYELAQWLAAPTAKTFEYILKLLKV